MVIKKTTTTDVSLVHHEVLLQRRPRVHDGHRGHGVERLEGDDLARELEAAVHGALHRAETSIRSQLQNLHHITVPSGAASH